ncbi:hypothetical protein C0995_015307 [Termitomyces sp. Mi166|nr:hypothetical protein C0995_015307 [Termitomyces sp. Mi166\
MPSSLKAWFQTQTESLYAIPPQTDTQHVPNPPNPPQQALFSLSAQIVVNHIPVALEDFQSDIRNRLRFSRQTSVSWGDVIEVYDSQDGQNEEGIVAGIFVLTRSLNFRIRAGPAQRKTTVIFSAKIHRDPTIHDEDGRRIVQLHQTQIDEAVPVHIHGVGSREVDPQAEAFTSS